MLTASLLSGAVTSLALAAPVRSGMGNCGVRGQCPSPIPSATSVPSATPVPSPTAAPTASGLTFDDEFSGTVLNPVWAHHYHCCGAVTMDPGLSTVSGGYLHQSVVNRSGAWYGDILDTKTSFTQTYGHFEARMKIARGRGFWPAFWLYDDAVSGADEIDTMEVCANPTGTNGGNDVTLLHTTVHKTTQANQVYAGIRTVDLSLAFHVYGVDWRPGYIAFSLDGVEVWRETSLLISTPKALLLDFGVGGSWCGSPDSTTPSPAETLIDYVRVIQ